MKDLTEDKTAKAAHVPGYLVSGGSGKGSAR